MIIDNHRKAAAHSQGSGSRAPADEIKSSFLPCHPHPGVLFIAMDVHSIKLPPRWGWIEIIFENPNTDVIVNKAAEPRKLCRK
jgi:hypothetical protein